MAGHVAFLSIKIIRLREKNGTNKNTSRAYFFQCKIIQPVDAINNISSFPV